MSGKNSAEYKAFFRNQAQIADTISDINGLNDIIVAKLRAMKIIGKTVRDSADIRGPHVTERQRVQPVLDAVLIKIELNKDVYYKFRDVLLSSEPGLKKLLPKEPPTEDESEDEGEADTSSGIVSTHTIKVPKHAKTSMPDHGPTSAWNCWECGCYIFVAGAVLALAVAVAILYINNGIPGAVPILSKPREPETTATGGCHSISNKRELEKAVAEIGDWETLCENLGVPKAVLSELRFSDKQTGRRKSECLEAYANTDKACWEHVVKVIADFPFHNKRLARQIADKQNVDYSSDDKNEL